MKTTMAPKVKKKTVVNSWLDKKPHLFEKLSNKNKLTTHLFLDHRSRLGDAPPVFSRSLEVGNHYM